MITALALTGHRPDKIGGYSDDVHDRLVYLAVDAFTELQPRSVISGMALGWDQAGAEAAIILDIPLLAYLPFPGQDAKWPPNSRRFYERLLERATRVKECSGPGYDAKKMLYRNVCMVNDCHTLLALWNGSNGGTAHCVSYALKARKPMVNLWQKWITR